MQKYLLVTITKGERKSSHELYSQNVFAIRNGLRCIEIRTYLVFSCNLRIPDSCKTLKNLQKLEESSLIHMYVDM